MGSLVEQSEEDCNRCRLKFAVIKKRGDNAGGRNGIVRNKSFNDGLIGCPGIQIP